ncbi:Multidrug and toxin extrusion protein 1 [Lamellibrachia satsuma]|nr:Multidrug and toxin extrusion protein 1 [Lamellibrachia satsuma]
MSEDEDVDSSVQTSSLYGSIVTETKLKATNDCTPRNVNDLTPEPGRHQRTCQKCCSAIFPAGILAPLLSILRLSWPVVATQVFQMLVGPISLIFCGHLGDRIQLDGAALGISMINVTCISIAQGLGSACDTFFSQTFGSKNKKLVGVYVQKAMYIFLLVLMPCYAVHLNLGSFLPLMGQNPEVSRLAGRYMVIFMPGALNIVLPNVIIGIVANVVNAVMHYVFLYRLHWGTDGSALSQTLAYFTMFALTLLYIIWSKAYKDTWGGWTMDSLQDWGKFARIAILGMLMLCLEWWGFEIGLFLTGK